MASDRFANIRNPKVTIDPSMDKYKDVVLFPEKLAKANEFLKSVELPEELKKKKKDK